MKYIVMQVKVGTLTIQIPVVFPEIVVHADMAEMMQMLLLRKHGWESKPISAGFTSSLDIGDTYGESESLNLKSRPEDSKLLSMCDYGSMSAC